MKIQCMVVHAYTIYYIFDIGISESVCRMSLKCKYVPPIHTYHLQDPMMDEWVSRLNNHFSEVEESILVVE